MKHPDRETLKQCRQVPVGRGSTAINLLGKLLDTERWTACESWKGQEFLGVLI